MRSAPAVALCWIAFGAATMAQDSAAPAPTPAAAAVAAGPAADDTPAAAAPAMGRWWMGSIESPNGKLQAVVELRQVEAVWQAFAGFPAMGVRRKLCGDVRFDQGHLSFTLDLRGVVGRFDGAITEATAAFDGVLALGPAGREDRLPFSLPCWRDPTETPGATRYTATLDAGRTKLPMEFVLADAGAPIGWVGTVSIVAQGVAQMPVSVSRGEDSTRIEFSTQPPAVLDLHPQADGTLTGTFTQGQFNGPIALSPAAAVASATRPQEPKPPFPYEVREAKARHPVLPIELAGTLFIPPHEAGAKLPGVLLVAGSGPNDRDETVFGHKPFLVWADALARAGFVVYRYDKRGVGGSNGDFGRSTGVDFATDADAASEFLKSLPEVDPARVAIVGHSEGAACAGQAAEWQWTDEHPYHPVAALVLLAGTGMPGSEVLRWQVRQMLLSEGVSVEDADAAMIPYNEFLNALDQKASVEELTEKAKAMIRAQAKAVGQDGLMTDADLEQAAQGAVAQARSVGMAFIRTSDPRTALSRVGCPVLAIGGSLDVQVDPTENLRGITEAVTHARQEITTKTMPGLNHLLQPATSGAVSEYATIEITVDPSVMTLVIDWLKAKLAAPVVTPLPAAAPAE